MRPAHRERGSGAPHRARRRYTAISAFASAAIAIEREPRGRGGRRRRRKKEKSFQNRRLSVKYGLHEKPGNYWAAFPRARARAIVHSEFTFDARSRELNFTAIDSGPCRGKYLFDSPAGIIMI